VKGELMTWGVEMVGRYMEFSQIYVFSLGEKRLFAKRHVS